MNQPGRDVQPTNSAAFKGISRNQWIFIGIVIAAVILRDRLAALVMWSFLIALVLFALLVLPAIIGAVTGSVTGEIIRRAKRLRVWK